MPHFSRLTDIVTCNLTELLENAADPQAVLAEIIHEMEQGLASAQRSVQTAQRTEERLRHESAEARLKVAHWTDAAVQELRRGDENAARMALYRKKEVADLLAGLEQQVRSAESNFEQFMTTYRALEARLAEALRKQGSVGGSASDSELEPLLETAKQARGVEVEQELEELKRLMQQSDQ